MSARGFQILIRDLNGDDKPDIVVADSDIEVINTTP